MHLKRIFLSAIIVMLFVTASSLGATGTWTGKVSSEFGDPNNWSPMIDVYDSQADSLTIGKPTPYGPICYYGSDIRPNSFNILAGADFTMIGGELLPYGNNTFNGNVKILNGEINSRGYLYIGNGNVGTVTVNGGTLTSKYTMYIGRNSGGVGKLKVLKGIVLFSGTPNISYNGGTGRIYIEEGGYCYISGNYVSWFENKVSTGVVRTEADSEIVIDYQPVMARTRITAEKIKGATLPSPWNGTEDTDITTLSWRPGTNAIQSRVYFGTDEESLNYMGSTTAGSMSAPALSDQTTYYWRVDTVKQSQTITGQVWSFTQAAELKPRLMEKLDRAVLAVRTGSGNYIGWRLFGTDPEDIAFNVYRGSTKLNSSPITDSTNFLDTSGTPTDVYSIRAIIDNAEQTGSKTVSVKSDYYFDIPLEQIPGDTDWSYTANDAAVGDLDGDGEYEVVIKRFSALTKDTTEHPVIEAYRMDGTFMWRINLGPNYLSGEDVDINPIVYDLDSDGFAEVALRTCEGLTDGEGNYTGDTDGDGIVDYRGYSGSNYIDAGPEFLSIFDGKTGKELAKTDYIARDALSQWGDNYGHRADKFHMTPMYLDGHKPSLVICRGIYGLTKMQAYNWRNGRLEKLWKFTSEEWAGFDSQGNHNFTVGDVDGDGKDEIVYGGMCVDHDGTGLYTTGYGHGDAIHMSDMDPEHPGLEVWRCIETSAGGATLTDAGTGQVLIDHYAEGDTGRCCAAHVDSNYKGYQVWSYAADGTYNADGTELTTIRVDNQNFLLYWDADLQRELLDATGSSGANPILNKWNGNGVIRLLSFYSIPSSYSTASNNWTKGNPCISGDLFGDWREEVIYRSSDNKALRIFTTTQVTNHRLYTLLHDPQYRLAIAWQCCGYNQPPHPGFYIGAGMDKPPVPNIEMTEKPKEGLLREYWLSVPGTDISDLTGLEDYPNRPTGSDIVWRAESPAGWSDYYGIRLRGYVKPETSGEYTFWICGDDHCQLFLSSDALAENAAAIASVSGWTNAYEWDKYASQKSQTVRLQAGHKYYIEALMKEGAGGDNLAVGWQLDGTDNPKVIEGGNLRPWEFPVTADATGDVQINTADFAEQAKVWKDDDCEIDIGLDLNGDCTVDTDDLSILAENWLEPGGLQAYFTFEEGSGTVAEDLSGYGRDGILENGTEWTSQDSQRALKFDGKDDFVEIYNFEGVTGTVGRTCAAKIKTDSNGDIMGWGSGAGAGTKWRIAVSSGYLSVQMHGSCIANATSTLIDDGIWHHIAVTMPDNGSVGDVKLYVDGSEENVNYVNPTVRIDTAADNNVSIGVYEYEGTGLGYFKGDIDEVRIYEGQLTAEQIRSVYHNLYK